MQFVVFYTVSVEVGDAFHFSEVTANNANKALLCAAIGNATGIDNIRFKFVMKDEG